MLDKQWWHTFVYMVCLMGVLLFWGALLSGCSTPTVQFRCPPLSPPPSSTLDALQVQSTKDRTTGPWVVDLERHYEKCDLINGVTKR